ncbi:MAG: ATP-dependent DNA ligase [Gammaproteobacteria bacterium]
MLLSEIVTTSKRVTATQKRLEKIGLLAECIRCLPPDEIEIGISYLAGSLPQGRIGVGYALVREALKTAAADGPSLTLHEVDATFTRLLQTIGRGSAGERRAHLRSLFVRATRAEQDFLARLAIGELRQGALEGILVEAIAQAVAVPSHDIRRAVMLAGDIAPVARVVLTEGVSGLTRFRLALLQPVKPMLADSVEDVGDALAQLGRASFEYKLDGARVQAHKEGTEVRVFTRSLNEVTEAVPEIVEVLRRLPVHALIVDGEALALKADGTPQPFQITMRRFGRKLDVDAMRAELPLSVFFFDCLHLEGQDLIDEPAVSRFTALEGMLPPELMIPRLVTADPQAAEAFLARALARGHEGVMAKALDARYEAGRRGASWLKIKHAFTLDLVVLAAEWGSGRRRGRLSNLHLGARDPASGSYVMLGKTFKGMSDAMLEWQTRKFQELAIERDAYTVYVRPELVVEVACNDIQASPHYPGGLALRFARVRRYRPDKSPQEADTIDTVRTLYRQHLG